VVVAPSIDPAARYFRRVTTDAPPPTRRALRAQAPSPTSPGSTPPALDDAELAALADAAVVNGEAPDVAGIEVFTGPAGGGTLVLERASAPAGVVALTWVDEERIAPASAPAAEGARPDLLARAPRRSPWRPGVLAPIALILLLALVYAATTLLWPLHAVAPKVEAVPVQPIAAPAAAPVWPAEGSAALTVAGMSGSVASTADAASIASITKVVTALLVLDQMPLAVGESGPEFRFSAADRAAYWQYRARGESALDVPVGGSLTEYQLLEGMLIGSANNYADRLAANLWPSDAVFASAAGAWLADHGVPGVTIVDPTGIEAGNTASPEALLTLAARAMAHPVIADIVGRESVQLPGAGTVENTNPLLADEGVVGIKTGSLAAFNLLTGKDIAVNGIPVRAYVAVLDQPDRDARDAATRALYAQLEQELQLRPSITAGTVVGRVVTEWGEPVDIVAGADGSVVLWNGGAATLASEFALGEADEEGQSVGTLTVTGPLDAASVDLALAGDVEAPDAWWRLTHPLDLFGLD
jgi:serine-type D-Ala-D-Ala carboxypeptidase (penicillin-binding protein 5/6)